MHDFADVSAIACCDAHKSEFVMVSPWITVARVLFPIEGVLGMLLNGLIIFSLHHKVMEPSARLYRYSCFISAVLSFYMSLLIVITVDTALMVEGALIAVYYGPLLFYTPRWASDFISVAFLCHVHTMWQMVPAPCILQWLSLTRKERTPIRKMVYAYSIPVAMQIWAWIIIPACIPSDELIEEFAGKIFRLHGTNLSDFHVYGLQIADSNNFDAFDLAIYDMIPSYFLSYAIFGCAAVNIWSRIRTFGVATSEKTAILQRRFFQIQIAQVFLPLLLMAIPLGFICVAIFLSQDLDNISFVISFAFWSSPACTALLLLRFIMKSSSSRSQTTTFVSTSQSGIGKEHRVGIEHSSTF